MTRVLIVEDNIADARSIQRWLAAAHTSFQTRVASDLSTAITAIRHAPFDAILLDLTLPDSQGVETVDAMCREAAVPIIVLSGHEDLETAMNCVRAGACSFLVKGEQLGTESLERELLYAVERYRQLDTTRTLLQKSFEHAAMSGAVLTPHVVAIETALRDVAGYLMRNHVTAHQHFEKVLRERGVAAALQELRAFTVRVPRQLAESSPLVAELSRVREERDSARKLLREQATNNKIVWVALLVILTAIVIWSR